MNIEDKALDIILDHTASSEWEDVCELTWNTDEVQELLIKALKQGQALPIDSVSQQSELLQCFCKLANITHDTVNKDIEETIYRFNAL